MCRLDILYQASSYGRETARSFAAIDILLISMYAFRLSIKQIQLKTPQDVAIATAGRRDATMLGASRCLELSFSSCFREGTRDIT